MYKIFFFKQKTAYEMRISDWSSDVCSSDLQTKLGEIPETLKRSMYFLPRRTVDDDLKGVTSLMQSMPEETTAPKKQTAKKTPAKPKKYKEIGKASCRERVCQYV